MIDAAHMCMYESWMTEGVDFTDGRKGGWNHNYIASTLDLSLRFRSVKKKYALQTPLQLDRSDQLQLSL